MIDLDLNLHGSVMTGVAKILHVRPLMASQFRQAFPLIRLMVPHLTLDSWVCYAEALCRGDSGAGGIVSAQGEDGYIYGLVCYRVAPSPQLGRTLVVEHFVALDLFDGSAAIRALIDAIERIARDRHCARVHLTLPHARTELGRIDGSLHGSFREAGYEVDSVTLCKRLISKWQIAEVPNES